MNGVEQALNQARGIKDNKEPKPGRLKFEWEHIERPKTPESDHGIDDDEEQKMDVDEEQPIQPPYLGLGEPVSTYDEERAQRENAMRQMDIHHEEPPPPIIWGMPKWGREAERQEVAKGVRLLGMEEVSLLKWLNWSVDVRVATPACQNPFIDRYAKLCHVPMAAWYQR